MKGLWSEELLLAVKCSFVVATVETAVGFEAADPEAGLGTSLNS